MKRVSVEYLPELLLLYYLLDAVAALHTTRVALADGGGGRRGGSDSDGDGRGRNAPRGSDRKKGESDQGGDENSRDTGEHIG